jgi:hypothetical protein
MLVLFSKQFVTLVEIEQKSKSRNQVSQIKCLSIAPILAALVPVSRSHVFTNLHYPKCLEGFS